MHHDYIACKKYLTMTTTTTNLPFIIYLYHNIIIYYYKRPLHNIVVLITQIYKGLWDKYAGFAVATAHNLRCSIRRRLCRLPDGTSLFNLMDRVNRVAA